MASFLLSGVLYVLATAAVGWLAQRFVGTVGPVIIAIAVGGGAIWLVAHSDAPSAGHDGDFYSTPLVLVLAAVAIGAMILAASYASTRRGHAKPRRRERES